MKRILPALIAAACTLAACSHGRTDLATVTDTVTQTHTQTRSSNFTAPPATTVAGLPPAPRSRPGERDGRCPYIRTGLNQETTSLPNVAGIEGNRIYRTTLLTGLSPIGCRFYFINPPFQATADIQPFTYGSAAEAHNVMVEIGRAGRNPVGRSEFAPGSDGVLYQTRFFGPDADRDWAFVFAKGVHVVVVHTEETTSSLNAVLLAQAIVDRF